MLFRHVQLLETPMDCKPPGSSVHGISPGKNTGVGCHALLQGIFPTQGLNPRLLRLPSALQVNSLPLSHQRSPVRQRLSPFRSFTLLSAPLQKGLWGYYLFVFRMWVAHGPFCVPWRHTLPSAGIWTGVLPGQLRAGMCLIPSWIWMICWLLR